jgi:hypothetical protein
LTVDLFDGKCTERQRRRHKGQRKRHRKGPRLKEEKGQDKIKGSDGDYLDKKHYGGKENE